MADAAPLEPATDEALGRAIAALRARFGERAATGEAIRAQHANAVTWHRPQAPDAVVFADGVEDIVATVGVCAEHRVPLVPFGTGTSLEGHVNAPRGGISLDLSRMDRILEVNPGDMDCTVEAGVTRVRLNAFLRDQGLFFPVDPGADCSLGGMAATRASGTNAVRYGTMRENVLRLTAVMPDGRVVRTAGRARKSAAGYDLTRLLVGSEGTLGVIASVTLRLHGIPEASAVAVCTFPTVAAACEAAIGAIQCGLPLARVELLDEVQIRATNAYSKTALAEAPTLFVEFHGSPAGVEEQAAAFRSIADGEGARDFAWASDPAERARLWKARNDVAWASLALRPGCSVMATDVCVPLSRLAACVAEAKADLAERGLLGMVVGHVGDGNFHVAVVFDPADADEVRRTKAFGERLARRAIAADGTCTGEHGVGQGKRDYLEAEFGEALDVMRLVKRTLDPLGIMNPGKILPDEIPPARISPERIFPERILPDSAPPALPAGPGLR